MNNVYVHFWKWKSSDKPQADHRYNMNTEMNMPWPSTIKEAVEDYNETAGVATYEHTIVFNKGTKEISQIDIEDYIEEQGELQRLDEIDEKPYNEMTSNSWGFA